MEAEYKGKIKFYEDEIEVFFPTSFETFIKKLGEMLGLTEDILSNIRLSYTDEDNDKIEIKIDTDYNLFIGQLQKNQKEMVLLVEVKDESTILIKKCSSSILAYTNQKGSDNINILSENIKNNNESLEMSEEINQKKNQNINEKDDKNIINNNIINDNNKNNNVVLNNPNIIQNNNIIENKNQNNLIINNNINDINNINNEPKNQVQSQPQQFSNIQNSQNQYNQNFSFLNILSFPYSCSLCKRGPLYHVLYFCKECKLILCHQCEAKEGPRHPHAFSKAQTARQFEHLNIADISRIEKFMDGVGHTMERGYNSVIGWFGAKNEEDKNKKNTEVIKGPQWVSLVQIARSCYDLRSFTDKQIEDALIKSKGNIDDAIVLLL